MTDTCEDCGEKVHRTKQATYNVDPAKGLLHRQSCATPATAKPAETEASVRRQLRL